MTGFLRIVRRALRWLGLAVISQFLSSLGAFLLLCGLVWTWAGPGTLFGVATLTTGAALLLAGVALGLRTLRRRS